jgi:putative phosphoesterase
MAAPEQSTNLESDLTVPPLRLLLISDTHLPNRARDLPRQVWDAVDWADIVIHAGDWVQESLLDELTASAARVIGVWGNNDGEELRSRLPEVATSTIEGLRFAVVHDTGAAVGREARCDLAFPDTDVLVFGHSHIPWDTTTPGGLRLLNPGSPTDRRRQPNGSFITAVAQSGALRDVQFVDVVR